VAILSAIACQAPVSPSPSSPTVEPVRSTAASPPPAVTYTVYPLPNSDVHVVTIPPDGDHEIGVAVADSLAPLTALATEADAIAAINAGFFDPQNGLTTSYITVDGAVVADPRQNPRLMENPDLAPYLAAILDRSEFRIYDCGATEQYAIARRSAPLPDACTVKSAIAAGPQLLPTSTGYAEGFLADNDQGERVRDAIGSQSPNARSAVGLKADGTVVFAIAAQRPYTETSTGMTLDDLADFLADLGVEQALNLDGGSSTGLYFAGESYYGRLNADDQPIERPIKSILFVR